MDVSNCLEMMILSDTLAINGVFNKAAKSALWDAHTVTHSEDFLHICQVLHFILLENQSILFHIHVLKCSIYNFKVKKHTFLEYHVCCFASKQSLTNYLEGLGDV